jgi:hypothetical protein
MIEFQLTIFHFKTQIDDAEYNGDEVCVLFRTCLKNLLK